MDKRIAEHKLVLLAQAFPLSEPMRSRKSFLHVSNMSTLTYSWMSSKQCRILIINVIHNTCNLRDTEVSICMILVHKKRAAHMNHHLNVR